MPLEEIVNLAPSPVAFVPVPLLHSADQLLSVAFHGGQVIVCQSAPLGFDFALELMPFSFDHVGIHCSLLHGEINASAMPDAD
jgi:hypothetical protein